jgi:hypothetical protein
MKAVDGVAAERRLRLRAVRSERADHPNERDPRKQQHTQGRATDAGTRDDV